MKIDSYIPNSINTQSSHNISNKAQNQFKSKALDSTFVNNGFSSIENKELNNNIGILQIADKIINEILLDNNISLDAIVAKLKNASFSNMPIFAEKQVLKDINNNILFDANRILNIIPKDEKDIYIFKKALRNEHNLILDSLNNFKNDILNESKQNVELDKEYLKSNANLFKKAHNTESLSSKMHSLLS